MKKFIFYFVFMTLVNVLFAQGNFFNKRVKNKGNDPYFKSILLKNDDFWITGIDSDGEFLSRFDQNMNVKWSKNMTKFETDFDLINTEPLADGNILFTLFERPQFNAVNNALRRRVVKTNSTMSNVIWTLEDNNQKHYITNIKELKNGNIVLFGSIGSIQVPYFVMYMLNPNGDLIFQKTFFKNDFEGGGFGQIIELNDGNLMLVGISFNQKITLDDNRIKLCKMNPTDFSILWQYDYYVSKNQDPSCSLISEGIDGSLYLTYSAQETIKTNEFGIQSYFLKISKNGDIVWCKQYGDNKLINLNITTKPDGSFMGVLTDAKVFNYFLNINTDGEIVSQFRNSLNGYEYSSIPCYDKTGNLLLLKNVADCKIYNIINSAIERRAANGKSTCSGVSNIAAKDILLVKDPKQIVLAPVANFSYDYKKTVSLTPLNQTLTLTNQPIKCIDTIFISRCEGDVYTVGSNTYTQKGIYTDIIKDQNCYQVIFSKLDILKKNAQQIDTILNCAKSLKIGNTVYTQGGTYQEVLKNKLGCDSILTLNIKESTSKSKIDTTICEGKAINIGTKKFTKEGTYQEVLKNKLGCDSTVSLQLKVKEISIAAPDSLAITQGEEVTINTTSLDKNLVYEWSPPDDLSCVNCPKTIAKPSESIDYTVKGTRKDGCEAEAKVNIKVFKRGEVFIPTAFSPDDNGINDAFTVFGNEGVSQVLDYSIFDRWGNQIFNQKNFPPNDASYGWNGKYRDEQAQQGVYIYKIQVKMANGKVRDFSGDVMVR
jgi:gliding motility-associated-like protein